MVIKQVKRVDLTKEEKKVVQCLMRDLWEIKELEKNKSQL